jgi:hypothetical protein
MITGLKHVDAFLSKIVHTAQAIGRQFKIPPSVVIAQAALETGWGQAVKGNAYFGIKQGSSSGASIAFTTREVIEGKAVATVERFRAYRNFAEAAQAYGQFLQETPRYQEAFQHTSNPAKFAEALQQAGYATDPQYAEKVKQIIQRYQLTAYDRAQPTTLSQEAQWQPARLASQGDSTSSAGAPADPLRLATFQSRPALRFPRPGAYQMDGRDQPPPVRTAASSSATSASGDDPAAQHRTAGDAAAQAATSLRSHALAAIPGLLWEQVQQFTWSRGWFKPESRKSLHT